MIDIKIYNSFTQECVCLHCSKNRKIVNKHGRIKKCISCTRFKNTPKSYVHVCEECDNGNCPK